MGMRNQVYCNMGARKQNGKEREIIRKGSISTLQELCLFNSVYWYRCGQAHLGMSQVTSNTESATCQDWIELWYWFFWTWINIHNSVVSTTLTVYFLCCGLKIFSANQKSWFFIRKTCGVIRRVNCKQYL